MYICHVGFPYIQTIEFPVVNILPSVIQMEDTNLHLNWLNTLPLLFAAGRPQHLHIMPSAGSA
jgi:hypothetical protein